MKPIAQFPVSKKKKIRYLLTDVDGTLTVNGRLPSVVLAAMENLQRAGVHVVPITGGPAGWCDHFARMWPVDGVIGENGAFYFCYSDASKKMTRRYWKSAAARSADRRRLDAIQKEILIQVPGCAVSIDQDYRDADLAIDFCQNVPALPADSVQKIKAIFKAAGANAENSSIHVNGWFGDYDKLAMARLMFSEVFNTALDAVRDRIVFCGDAPNDAPMFDFFPHSVGVANVKSFERQLSHTPTWITQFEGGYGFAELVKVILER